MVRHLILTLLAVLLLAVAPAAANDPVRAALADLLDEPEVLRVDARPGRTSDTYERINIYAKRGTLSGLELEELWMLIRNVTVEPDPKRPERSRIRRYDDAVIHAFLLPASLERAFRAGAVKDARVSLDGETLVASGTYPIVGLPSRLNVRGRLYATGKPEVRIAIERLVVGIVPMPGAVVAKIERDINPVINMHRWRVRFDIHSVRVARGGLLISSLQDAAGTCAWCLDPSAQGGR